MVPSLNSTARNISSLKKAKLLRTAQLQSKFRISTKLLPMIWARHSRMFLIANCDSCAIVSFYFIGQLDSSSCASLCNSSFFCEYGSLHINGTIGCGTVTLTRPDGSTATGVAGNLHVAFIYTCINVIVKACTVQCVCNCLCHFCCVTVSYHRFCYIDGYGQSLTIGCPDSEE